MSAMSTEIGTRRFPRYLWDIYNTRCTGTLRAEKGSIWKEIYFDNGMPVGASSNIINERLGRLLVRYGKLSRDKYEDSLILMKGLNKLQGETLVRMGAIKEEELDGLLRFQLRTRLLDLFGWDDGTFKFSEIEVKPMIPLDERMGEILITGITEKCRNFEMELRSFDEMHIKNSASYDAIVEKLGIKVPPAYMDGKRVDQILFMGREATVLLYLFLLSGAVTLTDSSADGKMLASFYEKIKGGNHFEILGLEPGCSDADIKKAYYTLAKQYHPDLFEGKPAVTLSVSNEVFCLISSAYEVLSDIRSRREYEDQLKRGKVEGEGTSVSRILLAEMEFKKGQGYLRAGNFEGAARSFQLAVDMNPEESEFYAYLGWATYNRKGVTVEEKAKAQGFVKKALSMNSRTAMAYYFLGFMHRVEGNIEAALKEFGRALRLKPDMTEALREIRLINTRNGKAGAKEKKSGIFAFLRKKRDA